jgi:cytochrome oxidase assembly protein ShyY1
VSAEHPPRPGGPDASGAETVSPRTRRQWIVLGLGAVLLAALCVLAAVWQWHRYTDREARIDLVEANYTAAPVALGALLPGPGTTLGADDVWQPAEATGTYRPQDTVLLRNRPVGGRAGFHVLVPFVTQLDGERTVLVVDRGFVPLGDDASSPSTVPDPPAGEVTVTLTMRADEPPSGRGAPAGQVQAIDTGQVLAAGPDGAAWADGATVGAYGQLRAEEPAPATALGALPEPDTDPGSHLSYTVQWCIFALGALGGYALLWRRETRGTRVTAGDLLAGEPGVRPAGDDTRARCRARRRVDEDYEDALLDAAARRDTREGQASDTSSA